MATLQRSVGIMYNHSEMKKRKKTDDQPPVPQTLEAISKMPVLQRGEALSQWLQDHEQRASHSDKDTPTKLAEWIERILPEVKDQEVTNEMIQMANGSSRPNPYEPVYRDACETAVNLRRNNPKLSHLPALPNDAVVGLQLIRNWCIDACKVKDGSKPNTKRKRTTVKEVSAIIWKYLEECPEQVPESARGMARLIGCSPKTVLDSAAWKALLQERGQASGRKKSKPKAVRLTKDLLETEGQQKDPLDELIARESVEKLLNNMSAEDVEGIRQLPPEERKRLLELLREQHQDRSGDEGKYFVRRREV